MKQLEARLETMEVGMSHTQDAMRQMREELADWKEAMQAATKKRQEAIERC